MECAIFCVMVVEVPPDEALSFFNCSLDEVSFLSCFHYGMCHLLFSSCSNSPWRKHRLHASSKENTHHEEGKTFDRFSDVERTPWIRKTRFSTDFPTHQEPHKWGRPTFRRIFRRGKNHMNEEGTTFVRFSDAENLWGHWLLKSNKCINYKPKTATTPNTQVHE
jgi:hypothetical protein